MRFFRVSRFFALFLVLNMLAVKSAYSFEIGTKNMVIDAGAITVAAPVRKNIVKVTAPGELAQEDTEYVLQNDIVADGTAFEIKNHNITLNLNGHAIVYNNKEPGGDPKKIYGIIISVYGRENIAIVNGTIRQGTGNGGGNATGWGHNPIFAEATSNIEIAGLTIEYSGRDVTGIFLHWGSKAHIHHNTFEDNGTVVSNRHQGIDVVKMVGADAKIHHNLVKRCRHRAFSIANNSEVYNNEIYLDSHATNSYGVMCFTTKDFTIHHNKIFGVGEHPVGVGLVNGTANGSVYSNYVEVQNTRHSAEYGDTGSSCIRMTWGTDNVDVSFNTLIIHAEENYRGTGVKSWGRNVWVGLPKPEQRATFHDNMIIANNSDGKAKAAAIAIVCNNESSSLIFRNNTVVSNWSNVLLADNYGHAGGYAHFSDNTFVRQDDHPSYATVRSDYMWVPSTAVFIDNILENGASLDAPDLQFEGKGKKEIAIGWRMTVKVRDKDDKPLEGARILIQDKDGKIFFEGLSDAAGSAEVELIEYIITKSGADNSNNTKERTVKNWGAKVMKTPYRVEVEHEDKKSSYNSVATSRERKIVVTL